MIDVSNQYKRAIKEPSRLLKSLILINNKTYSDSEILSINYDENLFMESEFSIGSAIMSSIEVELENTQDIMDDFLEGNEFEIKIGIETSTDTFEFISLGFFIIEDIDKNTFSIKIYANDRMIRFETDYITDLQFPATIKDITLDIANKAGVKLKTTTFINSDYLVSIKPDLKDITLRKALMYIAELAGGYARISRDGYLEIFNIDVSVKSNFNYASERLYTDEIINDEIGDYGCNTFTVINYVSEILHFDEIINDETDIHNYNTFTGDNLITFSNKVFTISTIDKVIVEIPNVKAELGDGENVYYIVDNLFCQNPNAVIENIYNVLSKISYIPYDGKLQGDPAFQAGDNIIIRNNGSLINTLITNRSLSYMGGLTEQYQAVGISATEKHSTGKGSVSIELDKAKTEINVMAGEIEQKVSNEEFENTIKQTTDNITLEIKNTKEGLESKIEQTADSITLEVQNNKEELESKIEQTAESITAEIKNNKDEFESRIEQTAESITSEVRDNKNELESQIRQTADSISSEIRDNKNDLESKITQTKKDILFEVNDTKNNLQSQITVNKNSISQKVTNGEFESYKRQTAQEISSKVTSRDVSTLVKQNASSWGLSINGKLHGTNYNFDGNNFSIGTTEGNNKAYHSSTESIWKHSDGSYTKASANGLERYHSNTKETYHYYLQVGDVLLNSGGQVRIKAPRHILAKESVILAVEQYVTPHTNSYIYSLNTSLINVFYEDGQFMIQARIKWNNLNTKQVEEGGFVYIHYVIVG